MQMPAAFFVILKPIWLLFYVYSSTSVSSPGETMPRSDSADSQSQAIQEEPLPSTSNDDEDPLAGKIRS